MSFATQILTQIGVYLAVILLTLVALQRFSAGFLGKWLRVKTSAGKLVLVKVRSTVTDYYRHGKIDEGWLVYRKRGKKKDEATRLSVVEGCVYRAAGVYCIDVDDQKDCSLKRDFSAVPGYDGEKNNSLHLRALYKPSLMDNKTKIMIILICIVGAIALIAAVVLYKQGSGILTAIQSLKTITQATGSITPIAGGA